MPRKAPYTLHRAARDAAHAYPALRAAERELRDPKIAARLDAGPHGPGPSRSTEAAALRELPKQDRARLLAVEKALSCMATLENAEERLAVVSMVFFRRSHTIEGAALQIPISARQAQRWSDEFIILVISYLYAQNALRGHQAAPGGPPAPGI